MDVLHVTDSDRVASEIDEFVQDVLRGRNGGNIGLKMRFPQMQAVLHGLHRSRFYLLGADSGVGKTTLADDLLLDGWEDAKLKGIPFKAIYYSLEISRKQKIAKWVARRIYLTTGESLPADYIMGQIEEVRLTDEDHDKVVEALKWVTEVLKDILIIDIIKHPTAMLNEVKDFLDGSYGTVHYVTGKDGKEYISGFTPHPEYIDMFFFWIVDHVALLGDESGMTTKQLIDRLSKYGVLSRNKLGVSPIFVQQFSTDMQSAERAGKGKLTDGALAPQRLDFGDSKYTYRDADVVLGMIKPLQFDKDRFMGYELRAESYMEPVWGDYFVSAFLMKNRFGGENRVTHLMINGMASTFFTSCPTIPNPLFNAEMQDTLRELEKWQSRYQPNP